MVRTLTQWLTIIAILIGIFLFISHGNTTVNIIKSLAEGTNTGIKTLQGRG